MNEYGLEAEQDNPSVFTIDGLQYNLSSPTLNITTSYDSSSIVTLSGYLKDITNGRHTSRLEHVQDISPSSFWTYQNEIYPWAYVLDHASCRYSEYHNWGFSFLILFVTSLLLSIWSIGTYSLWLYVQLHNPHQSEFRSQRTMGIYSSSVDLAQALRDDFGNEAIQPGMKESTIRTLIRRRGKAGLTGVQSPEVASSVKRRQEEATPVSDPGPWFQAGSLPLFSSGRTSQRAWNRLFKDSSGLGHCQSNTPFLTRPHPPHRHI